MMASQVEKKPNVYLEDLSEGLWKRTPPLFTALGMCPSLAVTTAAVYGMAMGLSTTAVLVGSTVLISLFRRAIPRQTRIPIYTVAVATLVTITELVLKGFFPEIHRVLGLFIPLIVVNCIILGRIESFAAQHTPARALADSLGYGLGFTWALTLIGAIREILGAGTLFGLRVMPAAFVPWAIMRTPAGAFWTMGILVGVITLWRQRGATRRVTIPGVGLQRMREAAEGGETA